MFLEQGKKGKNPRSPAEGVLEIVDKDPERILEAIKRDPEGSVAKTVVLAGFEMILQELAQEKHE